ncbi:MAG TPA: TIGR03435 family protein [Candidatus Acidoferrales bacterium]|jgi:uncharacterized protein (TIGR03435 family)|nr:TIGR03435 family protein [Candidatus Acidoferrales bacterium]
MQSSEYTRGIRGKRLLSAIALLTVTGVTAISSFYAAPIHAQSPAQATPATAPALEFEVATIKPNNSDSPPGAMAAEDGINMSNIPLRILLGIAFGIGADRITGGPAWLNDRYDINAKMDSPTADALKKLNPIDRRLARQRMMQALLIDRCKIAFHRETKELPVFMLVVAKGGPKIQESKSSIANPDGSGVTGTLQFGPGGSMTFQAMPLTSLIQVLSLQVGRTVLDKTGLTGRYDLTWQFNQNAGPGAAGGGANPAGVADPDAPSIFTIIQDQLGLKLEPGKGPVEIIVIDNMEKPSDN